MYKNFLKRLIDIILSSIGIIILALPMAVIAVIIRADSPGKVLFSQKRIGKNKKIFYILKFRTMRNDAPHNVPTHKLDGAQAFITKPGAFLRKYSLDELPQLINIFKGEMSVIGPRPALWNQYDLTAERDKYHANDVRPGLTGLAQIKGRDELSLSEKARLDGIYVRNLSFMLDTKCFLETIFSVLKHDGVSEGSGECSCKALKEVLKP